MKAKCKYCGKRIDSRGMPAHLHFRHLRMILREFARSPLILAWEYQEYGTLPHFDQKQLPAPNPLTVYSNSPLGYMASPIPEHRRPKGYIPPQGYSIPSAALRNHTR